MLNVVINIYFINIIYISYTINIFVDLVYLCRVDSRSQNKYKS